MAGIGSHESPIQGATNEWLTPPGVVGALGEFDLDPCSPVGRPWDTAKQHLTIEDDGLSHEWVGRVWMNPPYGTETGVWMRRLAEHGDGVALIFARTETAMFVEHVWKRATALFFLHGRLCFYYRTGERAKGNAGAPSVLVAYGEKNALALRDCQLPGTYVRLTPTHN